MAKAKLQAGAEFDLLTRAEVAEVLRSWQTELTRGVKFRSHQIQGNVDSVGVLALGSNDDGPAEGMAWAVTRFSVAPGPTLPAGGIQVYVNTTESPSSLRIRSLLTDVFPGDRGCVLLSGASLRMAGSGLIATEQVTVTMDVKEVPIQQVWSL